MSSVRHRLAQKSWSQDWPDSIAADFAGNHDFSQAPASSFADEFASVRSQLAAIGGKGDPVPLARVIKLLDRLDAWTIQHSSYFTWPPTEASWARAVRATSNSDINDFLILAACYPNAVRQALSNWPGLGKCRVASWFVQAYEGLQAKPAPEVARPNDNHEQSAPRPASPAPSEAPAKSNLLPPPAWMLELLELTRKMRVSQHRGLEAEQIDGFIKKQVHKTKGASDEATGYWFEDELIPALALLSPSQVQEVIDGWPPGLRFLINNPVRVVGKGRFWGSLRASGDETRDLILSEALPLLVDTSAWRAVDRYEMLSPMFELAKSEGEFTKRLNLWLAWGGDLDAQMPDPKVDTSRPVEENAFQTHVAPMVSARRWFASQNNPRWQQALAAYPERQPSRGPSP